MWVLGPYPCIRPCRLPTAALAAVDRDYCPLAEVTRGPTAGHTSLIIKARTASELAEGYNVLDGQNHRQTCRARALLQTCRKSQQQFVFSPLPHAASWAFFFTVFFFFYCLLVMQRSTSPLDFSKVFAHCESGKHCSC